MCAENLRPKQIKYNRITGLETRMKVMILYNIYVKCLDGIFYTMFSGPPPPANCLSALLLGSLAGCSDECNPPTNQPGTHSNMYLHRKGDG